MSLISRFVALAGLALLPPVLQAQNDPASLARRIAAVSSIAADEYALGVAGGRIISDAELTEARLFFGEARDAAGRLPEPVRADALARIDRLLDRSRRLDDAAEIRGLVDQLRRALMDGLDIQLDVLPTAPPSLASGEQLYQTTCASCHGPEGAGDGAAGAALEPPPADLTDAQLLSGSSPLDFFRKISVGIAGTAMTGYEASLTVEQRWALALYTSSLRSTATARRDGAAWVSSHCEKCPAVISDVAGLVGLSDDSLSALLGALSGATPPPGAVGYARTASAEEVLGADRTLAIQRVVARLGGMIGDVESLARAGDREQAQSLALEAYLEFEAIEREVGARSASAMAGVERAFADLRAAAGSGNDVTRPAQVARDALARAEQISVPQGPMVLAGQSLLIILREGLEAILIVAAVMAFLSKSGAAQRIREVGLGAGLGLGASLITAVAFATVIRVSAAQQEAVEGITMLLASVVLFWVASWMVSRIDANRWRAFVQTQVKHALSGGGAFALAGVAFLAVYREGVETILFYAALLGTADGAAGQMGVLAGFLAGAAILVVVYLGIQRWGLRLPLKPFFAATGILLTIMSVSFAGQGVAELQEAGWVPATPVPLPAVPVLGLFPTWQTLLAQLFLAAAFAAALCWIFWLGPRTTARRLAA